MTESGLCFYLRMTTPDTSRHDDSRDADSHPDPPDAGRRRELAVYFGGVSVGCWFCCPFWLLVWILALPAGLAGLTLAVLEYRAARRELRAVARAVVSGVLSLVGTAAAIAYLIFVITHPDLPVQG